MKRVRTLMLALATLLGTPAVVSATPAAPASMTAPQAPPEVDDDAARYSEREASADQQLAFRGSQGAQYTSAAQIMGVTLLAGILIVVVILVVAL